MTYLPRDGKEYFHWTFTGLPDDHGAVEVSIGGVWKPLTMVGQVGSLLLAGPNADPAGAVVVTADTLVEVRVTDTPETIIRGGGWIKLSDD